MSGNILSWRLVMKSFLRPLLPSDDTNRANVNYWRKDVHLVMPRSSVVRLTDRLDITIDVDWDVNPQIKQNTHLNC